MRPTTKMRSNPHRVYPSVRRASWCLAAALAPALALAGGPGHPPQVAPAAAGVDPVLAERIDAAIAPAIERGDMPGCVVLVGRPAGIVFQRAYGHRRLQPEPVPMTTDTLFDLASLTKPLAAATSVMLLVERGQLRLRDKVTDFFPEFADHGKQEITLEQLLVHSSGLIPDNPVDDYRDDWPAALAKICRLEPITPPGEAFKYSDVGYILLGKIVEQVSGRPIDQFAKEEVFNKLGMHETGYLPPAAQRARAAATEQRDGQWLAGEVHDPRAALMGGVAGHAGLFSTARDLAIYARTMLGRGRYGEVRLLGPATLDEMLRPRNIAGQRRALGWDIQSVYSRNRGETMSRAAFGHGGFTGTVLWIDPRLDLYVVFLSSRLHPDGVGEVNDLAGRLGTIAAGALQGSPETDSPARPAPARATMQLGIDVLTADGCELLRGKRVGLITNHTGRDRHGVSTIDRLSDAPQVDLVALFSPEHGIRGQLDAQVDDTTDPATGLPIHSLYGESRRPSEAQLRGLDVLVFDIQDIGTRFYTYISTMGLAMEAAAEAGVEFVVLDRPNPINGCTIEGPLLDADRESFVGYHSIPVRHGMTVGELARMFAAERQWQLDLTVVPLEGWRRSAFQFDTQLAWVNPSPNMRSLTQAVLYPGIGLLETTNLSVGRGTDTPFEVIGAPWIDERELAERLAGDAGSAVRVVPVRFTPESSKFAGQSCGGVNFIVTDWHRFRSFDLGLAVAAALRQLYRDQWEAEDYLRLLGNGEVFDRLLAGDDVAAILDAVDRDVAAFRARRRPFKLYR